MKMLLSFVYVLALFIEKWKHEHRRSWNIANRLINQFLKLSYFRQLALTFTSGSLALLRPKVPIGVDLIRVGSDGDGGYLVPNDLEGIRALFSPGVDQESSFELYFAELGLPVFLADGSVKSPTVDHRNFYFTPKFIGSSKNSRFTTLESWIQSSHLEASKSTNPNPLHSANLILQMDIEGYEFEALLMTPKTIIESFRVIVIELHYINFMLELNPPLEAIAQASALRKLFQTHYCCHVHPNNCCGEITYRGHKIPRIVEVTLVNRRYYGEAARDVDAFPSPLDRACVKSNPEIVLDKFWEISQQRSN